MKKEIKDLWVNALRSGEFKQCKGKLEMRTKKGESLYCALGVLSVLALCEGVCTYGHKGIGTFDGRDSTLSFNIQEWSGIKSGNAKLRPDEDEENGDEWDIATLNDKGYTFEQLARIIESNWYSM